MLICRFCFLFFFSSRRRHTIFDCDWSSDVCSSDLEGPMVPTVTENHRHALRDPTRGLAAVEDGHLVAPGHELVDDRGGDEAGATDDEDLHRGWQASRHEKKK